VGNVAIRGINSDTGSQPRVFDTAQLRYATQVRPLGSKMDSRVGRNDDHRVVEVTRASRLPLKRATSMIELSPSSNTRPSTSSSGLLRGKIHC
jgi:hypothetical protein